MRLIYLKIILWKKTDLPIVFKDNCSLKTKSLDYCLNEVDIFHLVRIIDIRNVYLGGTAKKIDFKNNSVDRK